MYRTFLILLICLLNNVLAEAQFSPAYTQYLFNGLSVNSAYAGIHDQMDVTLSGSMQWAGIKGAPVSQVLAAHSPFYINRQHLGAGISFGNYQIGVSKWRQTAISLNYKLLLTSKLRLSLGMQSSFNQFSSTLDNLLIKDPDDPTLTGEIFQRFYPTIGSGFLLYSDRFFVGLSTHDLSSLFGSNSEVISPPFFKDLLISGGFAFELNEKITLKPDMLLAFRKGVPVAINTNVTAFINDRYLAGLSYRHNSSIRTFVQFSVMKQLRLAYIFEIPFNAALQNASFGSHQIVLGYQFKLFTKESIILNPRYF